MDQRPPSEGEAKLCREAAERFYKKLLESLPRQAKAIEAGERQVSFSSTVSFRIKRQKGGAESLVGNQSYRERIPLEDDDFEVTLEGGQLGLF